MSDNFIEESLPIQEGLIEEQPSLRRDLWSRLKGSPNEWVWLGLGFILVSLFMVSPYIFFGSYFTLYSVGTVSIVLLVLLLGFTSVSKYSSPSKLKNFVFLFASILILWSFYHVFNYDRHVLVDYQERVENFPYTNLTKDIANPKLGDSKSFTISVNSTQELKFGPDFESLATEVHKGSKVYEMSSLKEFKPFTIYYGSDAQGKVGDIKGKRTVYGWFGLTSTDFVIELEK